MTAAADVPVDVSLGIVELSSIARGVTVADAMVKRAPVRIVASHPISPGKHLIVVAGGVAEVDEAMGAGVAAATSALVGTVFLPQPHPALWPLVVGAQLPRPATLDSVAVLETTTVCATVLAADAAAKAAEVTLVDMRLGAGIGGKAFFSMSGTLDAVEAAAAAGQAAIEGSLLAGLEIIPAPHEDLQRRLMW